MATISPPVLHTRPSPCRHADQLTTIEGVHNFREWRRQYPADVAFRIRRITGSGDVWVAECWD